MFSIAAWLGASLPMVGSHRGEPMPTLCPPSYRSIVDYSSESGRGNAFATVADTDDRPPTASCPPSADPLPGAIGVRVGSSDGRALRFEADARRLAPYDLETAGEAFVEVMREAAALGYLKPALAWQQLKRIYGAIAIEFDWPALTDARLSKLLKQNGCAKIVDRDRRGGVDKRTVLYLLR